jgi:hypothetical protein
LADVGNGFELPVADVATTMKFPYADVLVVRLIVAEVPLGSIVVVPVTIAGGAKAGANENTEPERFVPLTVTTPVLFASAPLGVMDMIVGSAVTTKLLVEVAVVPATVTEMGPVLALRGTLTTNCVPVAEETVADAPLKRTVFADGVVLNPCPRIVTAVN